MDIWGCPPKPASATASRFSHLIISPGHPCSLASQGLFVVAREWLGGKSLNLSCGTCEKKDSGYAGESHSENVTLTVCTDPALWVSPQHLMVHALFQEHSEHGVFLWMTYPMKSILRPLRYSGRRSLSRNSMSLPAGAWLWFLLGVALSSDLLPAREKHGMWAVHFYPEQHCQLDGKSLQFSECL